MLVTVKIKAMQLIKRDGVPMFTYSVSKYKHNHSFTKILQQRLLYLIPWNERNEKMMGTNIKVLTSRNKGQNIEIF